MKYRPEIDGLRAIAVIPVILFHAGYDLFKGGFVGVDVFFVISGYLITTILIEDFDNKRFSFIKFYERRARRILPVLFVVMLVSSLFAWMLLFDGSLNKFGNGLIGVSLFLSNVFFWRQQGYFEESAHLNPILHTWSLAVEEQYYIFFPIFLILAWRYGKSWLTWMLVIMAIASFLLCEFGWRNYPAASFYLPPTRMWELFAGSLAAFFVQKKGVQKSNLLAVLGLLFIVFSIFFLNEATPVPSVYILVPVLGTVLIVCFAEKGTFTGKFLSIKLFVSLGLISYSAYLWHQPIFAFFRIYTHEVSLNFLQSSTLILMTLLLSYLSWKVVEKPFRNRNFMNSSSIIILSLLGLLFIFAVGHLSKKVANLGSGEYEVARQLSKNEFIYWSNCDERKFMKGRLSHPLKPVNTVVVGSSRVMQINSRIMGENIQNLAVSGASIEDDIALALEALPKLNFKKIYISADPWIINLHDDQNRYKSIDDLYSYWVQQMYENKPPSPFLNIELLDSTHETPESLSMSVRNFLFSGNKITAINGSVEGFEKKAYDGSLIYNHTFANQTDEKIAAGFSHLLDYNMKDFEYDTQSIKLLKAFVAYLQKNEVSVNFILSPYHPHLYELMERQKPIFLEIENWYREFAEEHNIRVIGSYNSKLLGCTSDEFYDGMHPKPSCMEKMRY